MVWQSFQEKYNVKINRRKAGISILNIKDLWELYVIFIITFYMTLFLVESLCFCQAKLFTICICHIDKMSLTCWALAVQPYQRLSYLPDVNSSHLSHKPHSEQLWSCRTLLISENPSIGSLFVFIFLEIFLSFWTKSDFTTAFFCWLTFPVTPVCSLFLSPHFMLCSAVFWLPKGWSRVAFPNATLETTEPISTPAVNQ